MISSKKKKWSQTELDPIFLLLAAGNHNKYKMFQYMGKQLKWHFYGKSYYRGTNDDFNAIIIVFHFLKAYFWKASFLILLCLYQTIQDFFIVVLAQ